MNSAKKIAWRHAVSDKARLDASLPQRLRERVVRDTRG
jgi:hypothetical protein